MAALLISFKGISELIIVSKDGGPLAARRTCNELRGVAKSKSSAITSIVLSLTLVSSIVPGVATTLLKVVC